MHGSMKANSTDTDAGEGGEREGGPLPAAVRGAYWSAADWRPPVPPEVIVSTGAAKSLDDTEAKCASDPIRSSSVRSTTPRPRRLPSTKPTILRQPTRATLNWRLAGFPRRPCWLGANAPRACRGRTAHEISRGAHAIGPRRGQNGDLPDARPSSPSLGNPCMTATGSFTTRFGSRSLSKPHARRHHEVRALFDNRWLHLFTLDRGRLAWRYAGNLRWVAADIRESHANRQVESA